MKKTAVIAASLMMLLTACSSQAESSISEPPAAVPGTLTNKMTETERAEVAAISAFVDEISIYDEELDTEFLVHVTQPPDYDPEKTYPPQS